jgi:hypothetical protein
MCIDYNEKIYVRCRVTKCSLEINNTNKDKALYITLENLL